MAASSTTSCTNGHTSSAAMVTSLCGSTRVALISSTLMQTFCAFQSSSQAASSSYCSLDPHAYEQASNPRLTLVDPKRCF